MPSNRSKYSPEFREQTARHIIESGKSATSMAEELNIDVNTVCRWVRDFRKKHDMPTWSEEQRRRPRQNGISDVELLEKNKELEKLIKRQKKQIVELEEEKSILKKSLVIFAQPHA